MRLSSFQTSYRDWRRGTWIRRNIAGVRINGFHSVTACHLSNDNHDRRIPGSATAWNSDILLADYPKRSPTFAYVFAVAGVYDDFCKPHEMAGTVARIVVGDPGDGPGKQPSAHAPGEALEAPRR